MNTTSKIWDEVREEGAKERLLENIKALMKNLNFTAEQAMDALGVSAEEKPLLPGRWYDWDIRAGGKLG